MSGPAASARNAPTIAGPPRRAPALPLIAGSSLCAFTAARIPRQPGLGSARPAGVPRHLLGLAGGALRLDVDQHLGRARVALDGVAKIVSDRVRALERRAGAELEVQ